MWGGLFTLLLFSAAVMAQEATGRAVYRQVVHFKGSRMGVDLTTELRFNERSSLYLSTLTQTQDDTTFSDVQVLNAVGEADVTVYSDFLERKVISREYILTRLVTAQDTLRQLPWQLGTQSRQIGQFACKKCDSGVPGPHVRGLVCTRTARTLRPVETQWPARPDCRSRRCRWGGEFPSIGHYLPVDRSPAVALALYGACGDVRYLSPNT